MQQCTSNISSSNIPDFELSSLHRISEEMDVIEGGSNIRNMSSDEEINTLENRIIESIKFQKPEGIFDLILRPITRMGKTTLSQAQQKHSVEEIEILRQQDKFYEPNISQSVVDTFFANNSL